MLRVPVTVTRQAFAALNSVVRPLLSVGVGNPLPIGVGAAVLETTGRKSGLPRQVPLVTVRVGDTAVVSTVRSGSQWLANAEADEDVRVQLFGRFRNGTASVRRGPLNVAVVELEPRCAD